MSPVSTAKSGFLHDLAEQLTLGSSYQWLVDETLAVIRGLAAPPASIIEFGAGTGRITIPLCAEGYSVSAVEPRHEMYCVLRNKANRADARLVALYCLTIPDYVWNEEHDVVLCLNGALRFVFDRTLRDLALARMASSLRFGGRLFFDLPRHEAFTENYQLSGDGLTLSVRVTPLTFPEKCYLYEETGRSTIPGEEGKWQELFPIRYWPPADVFRVLRQHGIVCDGPLPQFAGTRSNYYLGTKFRVEPGAE